MSNWVDGDEDLIFDDRDADLYEDKESDEDYDDDDDLGGLQNAASLEEQWANAEVVQAYEVDAEGNKFEVIKKVRSYHVDRLTTAADLRAAFKHLGKGLTDQTHLVSKEPPLALEMGTVDSYERESRNEVKRFINELGNADVKVTDPKFAVVIKEERQRKQQADAHAAASSTDGGSGGTWGASRGQGGKTSKSTEEDPNLARRVRVTNLSDNITEGNLEMLFSTEDMEVANVFLPLDKVTNKVLGFAFITFTDKRMAEQALKKERIKYKNTVLRVSKAVGKK